MEESYIIDYHQCSFSSPTARDAVDRTVESLKRDGTLAALTVSDRYIVFHVCVALLYNMTWATFQACCVTRVIYLVMMCFIYDNVCDHPSVTSPCIAITTIVCLKLIWIINAVSSSVTNNSIILYSYFRAG